MFDGHHLPLACRLANLGMPFVYFLDHSLINFYEVKDTPHAVNYMTPLWWPVRHTKR